MILGLTISRIKVFFFADLNEFGMQYIIRNVDQFIFIRIVLLAQRFFFLNDAYLCTGLLDMHACIHSLNRQFLMEGIMLRAVGWKDIHFIISFLLS